MTRLNQKGSLSTLAVLLLGCLIFGAFGSWVALRKWNLRIQRQLALHECLKPRALLWKETLESIEADNRKILELRTLLLAGSSLPAVLAASRVTLGALVIKQDLALARWELGTVQFLARPCESVRPSFFLPLPQSHYHRPPPDPVGPHPLLWEGGLPAHFGFLMEAHPASIGAVVERSAKSPSNNWKAHWSAREEALQKY